MLASKLTLTRKVFLATARLGFGTLLLWAASGKIVDPERFAEQVVKYGIVGPSASAIVSTVLPWLEFLVGACLVVGNWQAGTWLATAVLFGLFAFARAWVLHRGMSIDCGCGVNDGTITTRSLMVSIALFGGTIVAYGLSVWPSKRSITIKPAAATCNETLLQREGSGQLNVGVQ